MALYGIEQVKWEDAAIAWNLEGAEWAPSDGFENVIFFRVLEKLHKLLSNEFFVPIYFDEHRGNQSFLITPSADNIEELFVSGQSREYNVIIDYQLKTNGTYTKNNFKQIAQIMERLKRLIYNNKTYSVSSDVKFYNASVESINYEQNEDDTSLLSASLVFSCTTMELV